MSIPLGGRTDLPVEDARAELKRHFSDYQGPKYADGWADLWAKGEFLPWDRGNPSPALADTLINHGDVIGHAMIEEDGQPRRKRALVPGCGRGVDVLLLQSFGYDVIGLEYAPDALKACEEYQKEHAGDYPVRDEKIGKGSARFLQGDFYMDDWLEKTGFGKDAKFDLIYDYTVSTLPVKILYADVSCSHLMIVLLCHAIAYETSLGKADGRVAAAFASSQSDMSRISHQ